MRLLDLFSGIGGFSLAAQWVWGDELDIVGFCEIDEYCQKVLEKNFPGVPIYEDITKLNGKDFKNIDLITGGFPCQDISIAGKGEGITGKRSGLWSEMHRLISEVRPQFAFIENVPMLIHRGLGRVLSDLAKIRYDAEWQIVGADDVGAWHRRKRIWIVAYPQSSRTRENIRGIWARSEGTDRRKGADKEVSHTTSKRLERDCWGIPKKQGFARKGEKDWWAVEPDVGRVAHGIPNRVDRLKGIGNAIVPQVAETIMKRIES